MVIKQVYIKNFKRFTDLLLTDIPANTKLVLLIGTNGSGKSCVFDAFEYVASGMKEDVINTKSNFYTEKKYYSKKYELPSEVFIESNIGSFNRSFEPYKKGHQSTYTGTNLEPENKFYGRSAVRFQARLEKTVIGTPITVAKDSDRPQFYIDRDFRFENDIELLLMEVVQKVFNDLNNKTTGGIDELKQFLTRINDALARIFSHSEVSQLKLVNFETPADGKPAQLIFEKGQSHIQYDFLSSGEKEIINLLINLYTRTKTFGDALYFIDEMDAHLNTTLQFKVIKEIIENWIPQGGQLWTASHSLGFIQYAKASHDAVIFDFDDLDFDQPQVLIPEAKDNAELYEIAVSKEILPALFENFNLVFVENEDSRYYASLNIKNTCFISEKNRDNVFFKAKSDGFKGLIDRDFLTENDCKLIKEIYNSLYILPYYSIENLLYHPDNLAEYFFKEGKNFNKEKYIEKITNEKNRVKDILIIKIATIRQSYPFFKEPIQRFEGLRKRFSTSDQNYNESNAIANALQSDVFEEYFPFFPMKDYGKTIDERQHINPNLLSKTNWFSSLIKSCLQ